MKKDFLIYSKNLSEKYESNIYLKPEYYGETKSHKDKWAKSIIKYLILTQIKKVVVLSSGNLALALASQTSKNDIECQIITWKPLDRQYERLFLKYKAKITLVSNLDEESLMYEKAKKDGYYPLSLNLEERSEKDLLGIEGFEITAKEILDSLDSKPDLIIVPCSYADHAKGILNGFKKLDYIPRFVLVRANFLEASNAKSIVTDITTPQVNYVIKKTNGISVFLTNNEFKEGKKTARKEFKLNLELSSAGVISVLDKLDPEEMKGKTLVLMLTALNRK